MIDIIHNSCQFLRFVIKLIINLAYFGLLKFRYLYPSLVKTKKEKI